MAIQAKICGLSTAETVATAVRGGADYVGFVFFPPSPRYVTPVQAGALAKNVPRHVRKVAVVVDAGDQELAAIRDQIPIDLWQCHGEEDCRRLAAIRQQFGVPVMKALSVSAPRDLDSAEAFEECADMLMFDAKAPEGSVIPGGNARAFDWSLLAGRGWRRPWMLSGGLTADNVGEAVRRTGARLVDVSSGVEERRGIKSPAKIEAFLAAVRHLES
ncbi:MAG: phosphoribosylanthranilate isomerase [Alphaproteobacteria bacterium]|nr:phosphoribosylanthranilate isomerase [Alphaproteobacteria bacterium]